MYARLTRRANRARRTESLRYRLRALLRDRILHHRTRVFVLHDILFLLRQSPLWRLGPLGLLPGTHIAELTASSALTGTAEFNREVLGRDLLQQFLLVIGPKDVDLLHGDGVEESLDDVEHAAETPGGIDQVQLAQALGVIVLRDGGSLTHVSVHRGDACDAYAFQIHDAAAGLEQLAGLARAGRQPGVRELFVLAHQVLQHALGGCDFVHGVEIDLAQLLNVDRAAILSDESIH